MILGKKKFIKKKKRESIGFIHQTRDPYQESVITQ
jgi:hypothetical protein